MARILHRLLTAAIAAAACTSPALAEKVSADLFGSTLHSGNSGSVSYPITAELDLTARNGMLRSIRIWTNYYGAEGARTYTIEQYDFAGSGAGLDGAGGESFTGTIIQYFWDYFTSTSSETAVTGTADTMVRAKSGSARIDLQFDTISMPDGTTIDGTKTIKIRARRGDARKRPQVILREELTESQQLAAGTFSKTIDSELLGRGRGSLAFHEEAAAAAEAPSPSPTASPSPTPSDSDGDGFPDATPTPAATPPVDSADGGTTDGNQPVEPMP